VEIGWFFLGIAQKVWVSFQVGEIHNNKRKNTVVPTNCNKRKINITLIMIFLHSFNKYQPNKVSKD
jgi:hypothetical protein